MVHPVFDVKVAYDSMASAVLALPTNLKGCEEATSIKYYWLIEKQALTDDQAEIILSVLPNDSLWASAKYDLIFVLSANGYITPVVIAELKKLLRHSNGKITKSAVSTAVDMIVGKVEERENLVADIVSILQGVTNNNPTEAVSSIASELCSLKSQRRNSTPEEKAEAARILSSVESEQWIVDINERYC